MTLGNLQHHIQEAQTAKRRAEMYHDYALAADWIEDRKFWKEQEAKQTLAYQLHASLVEEMTQ